MPGMIRGFLVLGGTVAAVILGFATWGMSPASLPNYLLAVVNVVLAIFALGSAPRRPVNRAFAIFALTVAAWGVDLLFLSLVPAGEREAAAVGVRFARLGLLYLFPALVYFTAVFTRRERPRWPLAAALIASSLLAVVSILGHMDSGVEHSGRTWVPKPNASYHLFVLLILFSFSWSLWLAADAWRRERIGRLRLQYGQFVAALAILLAGALVNLVATYVSEYNPGARGALGRYGFYGSVGGVMFFLLIAFAIVRHRWLDISFVVRRALVYSTLTAGIVAIYGAMLGVSAWLFQGGGEPSAVASIGTIAVAAFAFAPARQRMQDLVDRLFQRDAYDERKLMHRMTETIAGVVGIRRIAERILDVLVPAMKISKAQIVLADKAYEKSYHNGLLEKPPPSFPAPPQPVDRTELPADAPSSLGDYLDREGLELAFPVPGRNGPAGMLLVGGKISERPFRPEESQILVTIARQAAIAAENSQLYEEILAVKNYNEDILRTLDDGLVTFDAAGNVVSANPAAQIFLGTAAAGMPVERAFSAAPELAAISRDSLGGGGGVRHVEVGSQQRTLLVTSAPLTAQNGKSAGGLVLFADITDKKDLERRLERDRRLAVLGQLASQVAHEIRNPIGSMKLMVDSLPERRGDPEFDKAFQETVPTEIERLNRLVGDLLEYARPANLIRVPVDLVRLLEVSLRLSQSELGGIRIDRDFPEEPVVVSADGEKIKQVILNLFRNAAQAMASSPTKELGVRILREGALRIEISDTGIGMDEQQLGKIFTPFFSTKPDGTGLGLATSHRILEDHGWEIAVRSRPHQGTVFTIIAS